MKIKKITFINIILIILVLLIPILSFASTSNIAINSPACILIDANSGKIIFEKDAKKRMYPASTTKIMTAILTLENCKLSDVATVSAYSVSKQSVPYGYVNAKLQPGEKLTIEQLLNVLLIPSANDAANVLAEHISGSIENFSILMNQKALELGCTDTHFVNPSGIHDEDHYSTAYDLSLIAKYAMKIETFREFVCKTSYTLPATDKYPSDDREFETTNELLRNEDNGETNYYYEFANGIKTGYTEYANNCLVASAKKDNNELICVVLGAEDTYSNKSYRAIDCTNLFNYAFENYNEKIFLKTDIIIKQIDFEITNHQKTENKTLNIIPERDLILKTTTNVDEISPTITINENISVPILKGSIVGKIEYNIDNETYNINLIAQNDILNSASIEYIFNILLVILLILVLCTIIGLRKKKNTRKQQDSFDYKNL